MRPLPPGARIALVSPGPDISTNPTLVSLARRLADDGFAVDVYRPSDPGFPPLRIDSPRLRLLDYPFGWSPVTLPRRAAFLARLRSGDPQVILAVNPHGVAQVAPLARWTGTPLVYLSFEIFLWQELPRRHGWRRLKRREVAASRRADLVIVQDPARAAMLAAENGLDPATMMLVPVAPASTPQGPRGRLARDRFGIPDGRVVVLHSGSFEEWNDASALLRSLDAWPTDHVLLVHSRTLPGPEQRKRMTANAARNVIFSTEPMGEEEYDALVRSCDVGLVSYRATYASPYHGQNIATIGLSSGKFAHYMRAGLPTVTVRMRHLEDLRKRYPFGVDVDSAAGIPDALRSMAGRRAELGREARRLFDEVLCFDQHYPELRRRLVDLMQPPPR